MLQFTYQNAAGEVKDYALKTWKENSRYIQGYAEGYVSLKTFRKDRILRIIKGIDLILGDCAPPAPEAQPRLSPDQRPQILFTGFKSPDRQHLENIASDSGFRVMKTAGKLLAILCTGYNAGPAKIEAAREAGAFILTELEFLQLVETGELPDTGL